MEKAILKTLVYADVFDYPLTSREVYKFLISDKPSRFVSVQKTLARISTDRKTLSADEKRYFYFLAGREELATLRKKRKKTSKKKLESARKIAGLLKIIPPIKLVGVTGRLAMENSDKADDIDFLVVTSTNRLWLTRLLTVFLLELLGKRRRPYETKVTDKICVNMLLDEQYLSLPAKERDLYTAHEIVQMRPLWDKDGTYEKFLKANEWVREYLPNSMGKDTRILGYKDTRRKKRKKFLSILVSQYLNICECLAQRLQFWYMKKHRTKEVVSSHRALFHPKSARGWVLREYEKRLTKSAPSKLLAHSV